MTNVKLKTVELNPEDASVERPENRPFCASDDTAKNKVGILLVHGFTGSPWEMRDIGLHLSQSGAYSLGIRLPGHGTSAEDLAERSYEEWLTAVEVGHRHLSEKCDQVIGVGLSTGSLLLLAAAEKLPFAGLILLSPYLKMRQFLAPLAGIFQHWVKFNRRPVDIGLSPYYYCDRPIATVHQINRLIRRVKGTLSTIKIPTLVACSSGDKTVRSESAITLYNKLGSSRKEYYRFGAEVPHVLTTTDNPQQREVLHIASKFADTLISS